MSEKPKPAPKPAPKPSSSKPLVPKIIRESREPRKGKNLDRKK
jgi:hypothetical protein